MARDPRPAKAFIISAGGGGPRPHWRRSGAPPDLSKLAWPRPFNYLLLRQDADAVQVDVRGLEKDKQVRGPALGRTDDARLSLSPTNRCRVAAAGVAIGGGKAWPCAFISYISYFVIILAKIVDASKRWQLAHISPSTVMVVSCIRLAKGIGNDALSVANRKLGTRRCGPRVSAR